MPEFIFACSSVDVISYTRYGNSHCYDKNPVFAHKIPCFIKHKTPLFHINHTPDSSHVKPFLYRQLIDADVFDVVHVIVELSSRRF